MRSTRVANLTGDQLFQAETVDTFIIGDDGKFERNADGSFKVGSVEIAPGVKLKASGKLVLLSVVKLSGEFTFLISPEKLEVTIEAVLSMDPLGELAASGALRIDEQRTCALRRTVARRELREGHRYQLRR